MASIKQIQLNGVDYNLVDVDTSAALNNHISVTSNIQNQLNNLNVSKVNYVDELIIDCGTSTVNIFT